MKLVIADSSDLTRLGIRSLLRQEMNADVVGEAHSSKELMELLMKIKMQQLASLR